MPPSIYAIPHALLALDMRFPWPAIPVIVNLNLQYD